jgi:hypothetical protein
VHGRVDEGWALLEESTTPYSDVYVVVSPPRCSSTAFSRVLWQNPAVRYYSHEPFEASYFDGEGAIGVAERLGTPFDLATLNSISRTSSGLVIKEMPYQVGDRFPVLHGLATTPLVFLLRDPRQNIASRMEMKQHAGEAPLFPRVETGWGLLADQIDWCRREGHEFMIVDSGDFRNEPESIFPQVAARLGLDWDPAMLTWPPHFDLDLDNLGGRHSHLYRRVLESTGLQPADEPIPPLDYFPTTDGWRDFVERCLVTYRELSESPERLVPEPTE